MKSLFFTILCCLFSAALVHAQTPQVIQSGFTVERELGKAEKHIYEVNLQKGQQLNFVVEQRGIDLVLQVYAADGKFYDRLDSPNGREGDEPFQMITLSGGRFRIEITPLRENDPPGKYFIKPVKIRNATEAELKAARLNEELLKIVAEDIRFDDPQTLKRLYLNKALLTNPIGHVFTLTELTEIMAKYPFKPPEGYSFTVELSEAKMEEFGDLAVVSVRLSGHLKIPPENIDRTTVQRVGYVFKRIGSDWRIINVQRTYIERERKPIKLDAKQLEPLVGVYEGNKPAQTITVTREGNVLYVKFPEGDKAELTPESESTFYIEALSIAFIRDASGAVAQAVLHYSLPEDRIVIQPKVKAKE